MKVAIAGGAGLIGRALTQSLLHDGHAVVVLSRHPSRTVGNVPAGAHIVGWDGRTGGAWEAALDGYDALVNLVGARVIGAPWTPARKRLLWESRLQPTRALAAALHAPNRPRVFVSGSAVGYYGDAGDHPLPETAPAGTDYLARLCVEWEAAAQAVPPSVRLVLARTGIVLAREGALPPLALPFRFFLGGVMGRAEQWVPWIHLDDEVGLLRLALEREEMRGPLNLAGPEPIQMGPFSREIGATLRRPCWLPGTALFLRVLLGEQGRVMLASSRQVPVRALEVGYRFRHPTAASALRAALLG